jgi:hypothetical protein
VESDEQMALALVRAWGESLGDDADGEAAAEFNDLLQDLPPDSEPYDDDPRLRSLFGLIGGLNYLLERAYETDAEHHLVYDAFTDAMRLLAASLSERGRQVDLPDVSTH